MVRPFLFCRPGARADLLHRCLDQLLQRRLVHVIEALDVEATRVHRGPARRARTELGEKCFVLAAHQVERERRLARREADLEPLGRLAAGAGVAVIAEPDDRRAPHHRFRFRRFRHHRDERLRVLALLIVLDRVDEAGYACRRLLGFDVSHGWNSSRVWPSLAFRYKPSTAPGWCASAARTSCTRNTGSRSPRPTRDIEGRGPIDGRAELSCTEPTHTTMRRMIRTSPAS